MFSPSSTRPYGPSLEYKFSSLKQSSFTQTILRKTEIPMIPTWFGEFYWQLIRATVIWALHGEIIGTLPMKLNHRLGGMDSAFNLPSWSALHRHGCGQAGGLPELRRPRVSYPASCLQTQNEEHGVDQRPLSQTVSSVSLWGWLLHRWGLVLIADTKVTRSCGDFFIQQIYKCEELNRTLKKMGQRPWVRPHSR